MAATGNADKGDGGTGGTAEGRIVRVALETRVRVAFESWVRVALDS